MFSRYNHLGIIYFAKEFNLKKKNIFKNNRIVIDNKETNLSTDQLRYISNICKVNKIKLYIRDDFKLAIKIKASGIFLSANNKRCLINSFFNLNKEKKNKKFFKKILRLNKNILCKNSFIAFYF